MKIIISHPTGNANVRAAVKGFADAGMLQNFYTAIASFPDSVLDKMSVGPFAEIRRRQFEHELMPYTSMNPWLEAGRLIATRFGLNKLVAHEKGFLSIDAVYRNIDKTVARKLKNGSNAGADLIYSYEDGAKYSFEKARQLGMMRCYDLPIGYWRTARRLLNDEIEKWPEWSMTLTGLSDSEEKLFNKDEELKLADHIFVASSFTANTLLDFPGKLAPVSVIPYGFPVINEGRKYSGVNGSLKMLFVGGLSQRKGIANLFAAARHFGNNIQLTVVGRKASDECQALDIALSKHNWIPSLSNSDILKLMEINDVLIFPSLFEGFGLVITEAMSQGTPVITTDRTVGPDIIKNGENGWLVEAGSTEALIQVIENLLAQRNLIKDIGRMAMETAKKRPWHIYSRELAEKVASLGNTANK